MRFLCVVPSVETNLSIKIDLLYLSKYTDLECFPIKVNYFVFNALIIFANALLSSELHIYPILLFLMKLAQLPLIAPIIGFPTAIYDCTLHGIIILAYGLSSNVTSITL